MNSTKTFQSQLLRLRYGMFCLGKTFRARNNKEQNKSVADASLAKNTFTVIDDEGNEIICNVLFTFENNDGKHFLVYTDNTKDQDGNINVYASIYDPNHGNDMELIPIETEEEWTVIEEILADIQEKIKNGESVDYHNTDTENEDDDVLEPLPVVILAKLDKLTDMFHFPVGILPLYIIGVVIFHFVSSNQLPSWANIVLMFTELLSMRITYDDIEQTHNATAWAITGILYMDILMFLLNPLLEGLFPQTARMTFEPWVLRTIAIISCLVVSLHTRWKNRRKYRARQY